eukprot:1943408-Rhodomonas_salina.2
MSLSPFSSLSCVPSSVRRHPLPPSFLVLSRSRRCDAGALRLGLVKALWAGVLVSVDAQVRPCLAPSSPSPSFNLTQPLFPNL